MPSKSVALYVMSGMTLLIMLAIIVAVAKI
jgi:hypothetical protein